MRMWNITGLFIISTAIVACAPRTPDDGGAGAGAEEAGGGDTPTVVELFDGKSIEGWKGHLVEPDVKTEDVWSVEDGLLVCKGEPLGYLYTEAEYTSFRLTVEWRWAPGGEPGNNGVLMRVTPGDYGVPPCIESQLQHGNAGDLYGFHDVQIDGDPARIKRVANHELVGNLIGVTKLSDEEKDPGEWNKMEIVADGPKITVDVNGVRVNEATGCDVKAGPIAIQSEGGEIHFRRIALEPIDG